MELSVENMVDIMCKRSGVAFMLSAPVGTHIEVPYGGYTYMLTKMQSRDWLYQIKEIPANDTWVDAPEFGERLKSMCVWHPERVSLTLDPDPPRSWSKYLEEKNSKQSH